MNRLEIILDRIFCRVLLYPKFALLVFFLLFSLLSIGLVQTKFVVDIGEISKLRNSERENANAHHLKKSNDLLVFFERSDHLRLSNYDLCRVKAWAEKTKFENRNIKTVHSFFEIEALTEKNSKVSLDPIWSLKCDSLTVPQLKAEYPQMDLVSSNFKKSLVSSDLKLITIFLELKNPTEIGLFGSFDPVPFSDLRNQLSERFPKSGDLSVSYYGGAAFEWHFWTSLVKDQKLNLIFFTLLLLGFRLMFGTWRGGFLLGWLVGTSSLIVFSMMGLAGDRIDILTNGLMIMIAFATTEDFIYLVQLQRSKGSSCGTRGAWNQSFRSMILPSFLTSMTTVIGFGSLAFSEMESVHKFGVWAAAGAGAEWLVMFFVLPSIFKLYPKMGRIFDDSASIVLKANFINSEPVLGKKSMWFAHIALVLGCIGFVNSHATESIRTTWKSDHEFSKSINKVESTFGWNFILELNFLDKLDPALVQTASREIAKLTHVARVESASDIVSASLEAFSEKAQRDYYEFNMKWSDSLERYYKDQNKIQRKYLYISTLNPGAHEVLITEIETICGDRCFLSGKFYQQAKFMSHVVSTFKESFSICLLIIIIFLYVVCRALKRDFSTFAQITYASVWGVICFVGFAPNIWGGINLVTCVFGSILLGLAGDNAIHYLFASRSNDLIEGVRQRQVGTVQVTFFMVLASVTYLFSSFLHVQYLGGIFAAGAICLLVGDLVILRTFLNRQA